MKDKFYYIKVKEYIKEDFHNGFYDMGYFDQLEYFVGADEKGGIAIYLQAVSEKSLAKRYKYKAWAEKKIKETYEITKKLKYYYPYEDNIYKYKFEIVEE